MATKSKKAETEVIVHQVSDVVLTKMNSKNSMEIYVRSGRKLLGTLILGRGSVEWKPEGHSVNTFKKSWRQFAAMLDSEIKS
jgi:hypothetical protein